MFSEYEWDEAKRLSNIAKHGLDFTDVDLLFNGPHIEAEAKTTDGETRRMATGLVGDVHATVIFTVRGDAIRIISLRRARDGEKRRHQAVFGG